MGVAGLSLVFARAGLCDVKVLNMIRVREEL